MSDDENVVAKVLVGEDGELTEKTAQQLVLEDLGGIMEVLPPLAERDFMEADRPDQVAKESAQGAQTVSYVVRLGSTVQPGSGEVELNCSGRAVGDSEASHPSVEGAAAGRRDAGHA